MRFNPFESQLEKLARTLTEQFGVEVICRGDNAWTDGQRIVVPSVPEPMDEGLERMMVGFLDHEMGHVAFSDFQVVEQFMKKHPGKQGLLNVVEDALIERRAMQRWPGVRRNLDLMFQQIRGRIVKLLAQRGPFDRFCTAVYLKLSHHKDLLGLDHELVGYEDLLDRFAQVQDTHDSAGLAEALLNRWQQKNPSATQPNHEQGQDDQSCSDANNADEGSSQSRESNSPAEPGNSSQFAGKDGEESFKDGEHSSTKPNPQEDGEQKSDASDAQSPGAQQTGDEQAAENESPNSGAQSSGDGAGGIRSPNGSLISEALKEAIEECTSQLDGQRQYRPYTREGDRIAAPPVADQVEVQELFQEGGDTVRRMRRGLINALRSAEKRWWKQDQLRGRLSSRRLYRLGMDRPRLDVFETRAEGQGRATAVSVLLDTSGSMSRRKMNVARQAMRVLLEALAELKVATEALTFTTGDQFDITELVQTTGVDARELRERYGRLSNLEIGLIKQFEEPVKRAVQRLPNVHGTGLTPLGEAMQLVAARLIQRREQRRVLLVLTDGRAGCEGGGEAATAHACEVARRITAASIELIGVGIVDEHIREVVADSMVIGKLEELPAPDRRDAQCGEYVDCRGTR